jgi:hypothetical protein
MVSSTEIPKAILNTSNVEGFNGTPKKPMIPPVITRGIKLGIIEISTILQDLKRRAINTAIEIIAKAKLENKLFTKCLVPSAATTEVPVKVVSKY